MNYTEKYHLPQWDETDRIMRTDFNQMCADMEVGLEKTAKDAAAANAKTVADAAAANAKTAADAASAAQAAQSAADAAQATADAAYCPTYKPYVVGSYVGTAADMTIDLGFKPSFVIVSGQDSSTDPGAGFSRVALAGAATLQGYVRFTSTGFVIHHHTNTNTTTYPQLTQQNKSYVYIAFR